MIHMFYPTVFGGAHSGAEPKQSDSEWASEGDMMTSLNDASVMSASGYG